MGHTENEIKKLLKFCLILFYETQLVIFSVLHCIDCLQHFSMIAPRN